MSSDFELNFKRIVLVTGFGPFEGHDVNASWEAVKLLRRAELEDRYNIELVTLELPVTYENVDEFVPALWSTHEPKLVIHTGVSRLATELTVETTAHRKGYKRLDYLGKCPENQVCRPDGALRLKTKIDVDKLCESVNEKGDIKAVSSCDAGRYLCEYIYYTSLREDSDRVVFVHVPDMHITPPEQTARGLEHIIGLCLQQIDQIEAGDKNGKGDSEVCTEKGPNLLSLRRDN